MEHPGTTPGPIVAMHALRTSQPLLMMFHKAVTYLMGAEQIHLKANHKYLIRAKRKTTPRAKAMHL
jgi:hypothetical protein